MLLLTVTKLSKAQSQSYAITELGMESDPVAINDAGEVVANGSNGDPFLYLNGAPQDLGNFGGISTGVGAVNNTGQFVGATVYSTTYLGSRLGFINSGGTTHYLGTLGGVLSDATAINNAGDVVGYSTTSTGSINAFLFDGSSMTDLGALDGSFSEAEGINDSGQVVGVTSTPTSNGYIPAFQYSGGIMQDLGTLGGNFSEAYAINNSGQIAGDSATASGQDDLFLYRSGVMTDLGNLGGQVTVASGINKAGQIVGTSITAANQVHAFTYNNGQLSDLNTLIPTNSGWTLLFAKGINDRGQIVGTGNLGAYLSGSQEGYLLTPFTKFKQFTGGNWAPNPPDPDNPDQYVNPSYTVPNDSTFSNVGCTVTSLATICTLLGAPTDPLSLSRVMLQPQANGAPVLIDPEAEVKPMSSFAFSENGITVRTLPRGHDLTAAVSQLQLGSPIMLAVPYEQTTMSEPAFHYIVAYSLLASSGSPGPVTASDILISDPGGGDTWYNHPGVIPGYDVTKEATFGLTLQNYFDAINYWEANSPVGNRFVFDPTTWFGSGAFTTPSEGQLHIPKGYLNNLITPFTTSTANPGINVNSPVDLILTDTKTGIRYVSSDALAGPGDVVLEKINQDIVAPISQDTDVLDAPPAPEFSPYFLTLPDSIEGDDLDVQIVGDASGDYTIQYMPDSANFAASASLSGLIEDGQVIDGQFTITAVPEPTTAGFVFLSTVLVIVYGRLGRKRS